MPPCHNLNLTTPLPISDQIPPGALQSITPRSTLIPPLSAPHMPPPAKPHLTCSSTLHPNSNNPVSSPNRTPLPAKPPTVLHMRNYRNHGPHPHPLSSTPHLLHLVPRPLTMAPRPHPLANSEPRHHPWLWCNTPPLPRVSNRESTTHKPHHFPFPKRYEETPPNTYCRIHTLDLGPPLQKNYSEQVSLTHRDRI